MIGQRVGFSLLLVSVLVTIMLYKKNSKMFGGDYLHSEKPELPLRDFFKSQTKYLAGGNLEYVTFYSQQDPASPEKKIERSALLFTNPQAEATILVCHGFMCDKFDISFIRRTIFSDYNVMLFDFRAHGEHTNEEQCCTFGRDEALDVIGAVNYLKSRDDLNSVPRIVYGFSMGAVAAIQAQAADSSLFSAMVLDCPFDKSANVLRQSIEKLKISIFGYTFDFPGKKILEKYAFNSIVQSIIKSLLKTVAQMDATSTNTYIYPLNPVDSIKKISVPIFFIHCMNDDKVSVRAAKSLFNNAQGYKRLWLTLGRRHFDSIFYNPEKYIYKVRRFIQSVLNGEIHNKVQEKIHADVSRLYMS